MCGVHSSLPLPTGVVRKQKLPNWCTLYMCKLQGQGEGEGARAPVPHSSYCQWLITRLHCSFWYFEITARMVSLPLLLLDDRRVEWLLSRTTDQDDTSPMEKWTKSTFYSATANEVSNGKNGLSPHFGQLFLGNLFLWLSPLFVCALHIRCH